VVWTSVHPQDAAVPPWSAAVPPWSAAVPCVMRRLQSCMHAGGGSEQVAASRWCLLCALTGRLAAGMVRVSVGRGRQGSESVVASLRHTTAVTHRQGEWQSDSFATVTQCVKAARGGGVCNRCVRETDACVRREAQGGLRGRGDGIPHRMDARAEEGAAQGSGRVPPLPPPSSTRLWRWRDVWTAGW